MAIVTVACPVELCSNTLQRSMLVTGCVVGCRCSGLAAALPWHVLCLMTIMQPFWCEVGACLLCGWQALVGRVEANPFGGLALISRASGLLEHTATACGQFVAGCLGQCHGPARKAGRTRDYAHCSMPSTILRRPDRLSHEGVGELQVLAIRFKRLTSKGTSRLM